MREKLGESIYWISGKSPLWCDLPQTVKEAWYVEADRILALLARQRVLDAAIEKAHEEWCKSQETQGDYVSDGFGSSAPAVCDVCHTRSVYVCRPGDIRCSECEDREYNERFVESNKMLADLNKTVIAKSKQMGNILEVRISTTN
jgi:hypothetical protein